MAKVLIVDDEDELVSMIGMLVEDLGHEVISAPNGKVALSSLADQTELPALIISDVMMPQMNGVEFVRNIRTNPSYQRVPVILMSAAGPPLEYDSADYFIHKPFDLDTLADIIEQYVGA